MSNIMSGTCFEYYEDHDKYSESLFSTEDINERGMYGLTRLDIMCTNGNEKKVTELIREGADVNGQIGPNDKTSDDGSVTTPLIRASLNGHLRSAEILLMMGANANKVCNFYGTALHCASSYGYGEIVKLILRYRGDANIKDNLGRTPLHLACKSQNIKTVETLVKNKASINATDNNNRTSLYYLSEVGNKSDEQLRIANFLAERGATMQQISTCTHRYIE